jgi:hypothetical protein
MILLSSIIVKISRELAISLHTYEELVPPKGLKIHGNYNDEYFHFIQQRIFLCCSYMSNHNI